MNKACLKDEHSFRVLFFLQRTNKSLVKLSVLVLLGVQPQNLHIPFTPGVY